METTEEGSNEDLREVIHRIRGRKILSGFQINHITLSDIKSGKVYWTGHEDFSNPGGEHEVRLPKTIFECGLVRREINFSSAYRMRNLRIDQLILFKDRPIEEAKSEYGCVIPYSVNNWQTTIKASPDASYMPHEKLSGHIIIKSSFYDEDTLICISKMRLFYI